MGRGWRWPVVLAMGLGLVVLAPTARASAVQPAPTPLPAPPRAESEPNDTPATASPIASGERVRAPLFGADDVDYYRFSARAGDHVFAAVLTSGSSGSSTDAQLTLLGPDGSTVIEFDDGDGTETDLAPSIAGAAIPSDGTYYLRVNDSATGAVEMPYDLYLQVRAGAPEAEFEPNNTLESADLIEDGYVAGTRNPPEASEVDWYSMHLQAGDTVFLSLDLDPERDGSYYDGRLGIGPAGDQSEPKILVVNDPGEAETPNPTIPSEALAMTVGEAGTYYAFVDAPSPTTGGPTANYRLSTTIIPAAEPSCRSYPAELTGSIFDGGLITSPITVGDSFRIGRAALRLDLRHGLMSDLDVSLQTPEGGELGVFTDIGAATLGGQEQMDATFDPYAAIPPLYVALRPLMLQPEPQYRLDWLEGMEARGEWHLALRDDELNGTAGDLEGAKLILCEQEEPKEAEDDVFAADFEDGADGFTHAGTHDEWELGLPATAATATPEAVAGLHACGGGFGCFKTDLDGTYESSSTQDLVSPPISLAGVQGPIYVSWEQWLQIESAAFDHVAVSVEEEGGGSRRALFTWTGPTMLSVLGNPVTNPYHPAAAGWGLHRADISSYAGRTIRLRFHLDSDEIVDLAGLAIDDVRVSHPHLPGPPGEPEENEEEEEEEEEEFEFETRRRPVRISKLAIRPRRFQARAGATVSYTVSRAAKTMLVVLWRRPGAGFTRVGSFSHFAPAGKTRVHLSGRIQGRQLKPGRYRLEAFALSSGRRGPKALKPFEITP